MSKKPDLSNYVDVAERIEQFRQLYPNGSLRQVDLQFVNIGGKDWVVYTAAAYRTPDDPAPGMGTAWEPIPGRTPYTKDSEVMVAETSAWGRALVATLAVDAQRGVASYQEVLNRQTPERDFLAESLTVDTLEALRSLWQEARKAGASAAVLDGIMVRKNELQG
jgi:hypothetical protein